MMKNQSLVAATRNLFYSLIVNRKMSKRTYHLEGLVGSRCQVDRGSAEMKPNAMVLDQDYNPFGGPPALVSGSNSHAVLDDLIRRCDRRLLPFPEHWTAGPDVQQSEADRFQVAREYCRARWST